LILEAITENRSIGYCEWEVAVYDAMKTRFIDSVEETIDFIYVHSLEQSRNT